MMLPWPYMMTAWWFGTTRVEAWEDSLPTTHYPLSTIHYPLPTTSVQAGLTILSWLPQGCMREGELESGG